MSPSRCRVHLPIDSFSRSLGEFPASSATRNIMLWKSRCLSWTLTILLIRMAQALQVTPNSPCSSFCIDDVASTPMEDDSSEIWRSDIICEDWELEGPKSTVRGRKWKDCLDCEKSSKAIDVATGQNEVYWLLGGSSPRSNPSTLAPLPVDLSPR